MPVGPVEFVVISFPDEAALDRLVPALAELERAETIHVLDLLFIERDADGDVVIREFDELGDPEAFAALDGEVDGLISDEDALAAGELLGPNTSAVMIVWEDRWARPFAEEVRAIGGRIVTGERIPHEIIEAALADLPDSA